MAKIKPHKIMIEFDENDNYRSGIFIYRVEATGGNLEEKYKTINLSSVLNPAQMTGIINQAKNFAKQRF